jgi:hypothetical protein
MVYRVDTFEDILNAIITRGKINPNSEAAVNELKQKVNVAQTDICYGKPYRWSGDTRPLVLKPKYTAGTVDVTNASITITGTATAWTDDLEGRKFIIPGQTQYYKIVRVNSATSITINPAYLGDTDTGKSYSIFQDEYGLFPDLQDVRTIRHPDLPYLMQPISIREMDNKRSFTPDMSGTPQYFSIDGYATYNQKTWGTFLLGTDFFEDNPDVTLPRNKKLIVWPSMNTSASALLVRFTKICPDLVNASDQSLIPYESRYIIVLHVLVNNFLQERDFVTKNEWKKEYKELLKKMAGDIETTDDQLILKPTASRNAWSPSQYGGGYFRRQF